MKRLFSIILLLFISSVSVVMANTNIVFIDMDKVISVSKAGSSILKQLNELNNKNIKYLKNFELELKDKEKKLIAQQNIISEVDFKSNIDELRLEINNHKKNRNKIRSDFTKLKVNNTQKLIKLITPILTEYSVQKSISIILQKKDLIIGKTELDITSEIIKIVDDKIKGFKIK